MTGIVWTRNRPSIQPDDLTVRTGLSNCFRNLTLLSLSIQLHEAAEIAQTDTHCVGCQLSMHTAPPRE